MTKLASQRELTEIEARRPRSRTSGRTPADRAADPRSAAARLEDDRALAVALRKQADDLAVLVDWAKQGEDVAADFERGLEPTAGTCRPARSARCSAASTTARTRSSRFIRAPAAPSRRTGPRCCCACTSRWTERRGFKREIIDFQPGDEAGIKSVTLTIDGDYAYGLLAAEAGVHRLVRISPFDQAARRHTSFASLYVWPELPDDIDIEIDDKDLRIDTFRSSGRGRPARERDRLGRAHHAHPDGHRRVVSERAVAAQEPRVGHEGAEVAALRPAGSRSSRRSSTELGGEKKDIAFGSQIRSYVLHPYQMVKDHRTKYQVGDVNRVLDGDLDDFIKAYLMKKATGKLSTDDEADVD